MNDEAGRDYSYWEISRVVKEDLRAVPIRAYNHIRIEQKDEHERGRIYYKPWFVTGRNSASNVGVAHILSHIFNAVQHVHSEGKYAFAKMDINLFNKFWQVFSSSSLLFNARYVGLKIVSSMRIGFI